MTTGTANERIGPAGVTPMQARPTGSARLNPFAFAADTDLRFLLLIVLVASTSLFAYDILRLINPLATPGSPLDDVLPTCRDAATAAFPEGSREANDAFL